MPLFFPGEKIFNEETGALGARVCAHCLHMCMYPLMRGYTPACTCACKFVHVYVCAYCTHVPVQVCTCISVHAGIRVHICVCTVL